MASFTAPRMYAFKSTAAQAAYTIVKAGAARDTVQASAAGTDLHIGIAQSVTYNAGEIVEVALPGGGAKVKLAGTVAFGNDLTSNGAGLAVKVTGATDKIIAKAMESGVAGDIIAVEVALQTGAVAQ